MTNNPGGSRWYAVVPKITGTTGGAVVPQPIGGTTTTTRGRRDPHTRTTQTGTTHHPSPEGHPAMPRTPYTDGCPNCVLTHNQPTHTEPIDNGTGVLAHYQCSLCNHTWTCAWQVEPAPADPGNPLPAKSDRSTR